MADKPKYSLPTDQQNYLDRLAAETEVPVDDAERYAVEGNDREGYVGVSPEYQNYSSDIFKPGLIEEDGPLKDLEVAAIEATDAANDPELARQLADKAQGVEASSTPSASSSKPSKGTPPTPTA